MMDFSGALTYVLLQWRMTHSLKIEGEYLDEQLVAIRCPKMDNVEHFESRGKVALMTGLDISVKVCKMCLKIVNFVHKVVKSQN